MLEPGGIVHVGWTRRGEDCGSIGGVCREDGILFKYDWNDEPTEQWVRLEWQPWRFGGRRRWFRCPSIACGRRALKLYQCNRYFACRVCANLAYQSQHDNWGNRALSKAQNIRRKLGGSPVLWDPFPEKPRGMHWRTYSRLWKRYNDAEQATLAYSAKLLGLP